MKQDLTPKIIEVQKSLGIQNPTGQLDVASLQTMLTKLNSGVQAAAPAAAPVTGTPGSEVTAQSVLGQTPEQLQQTIKNIVNRPV